VKALVDRTLRRLAEEVDRFGGSVDKFIGDNVMGVFGAPVAHEDDPERAVRAALEMVESTNEFARQLKQAHGIDFRIRAGINSGPVLVGNVGTDLRYEYTALGDAVNVAARVQTSAEPGTVLISAATQRFVSAVFDFDDLGEVAVKGKSEPVHVYRVLGVRAEPGRRRGLEAVGLSSPLVGRAAELQLLTEAWAVARAGRGRQAIVVGEPGIGKSRLLSELRAAITDDGGSAAWFEGRCVSYGRGVPYHLVLDLVHSLLDIPPTTPEQQLRGLIHERLVGLLADDAADVEVYFAHLFGLPLGAAEAERVQLDPETLQGRYVAAIKRVIAAHAERRPLVIVLEDFHWADPASVAVMLMVLPLLTALPVLVLLAGRSETDSPGWRLVTQTQSAFGAAVTELRLQPLSEDDSRALVANLLEIESLPDSVRQQILTRSEGNPFFVEEVIRMFIENGAIVRTEGRWLATDSIAQVEIPDTLHGLLLARIDQLSDDAKRSLRVASVIGRQFPVRVLERVLADG
ncbi:MAG TPA: AAA family ATPase, partial [Candidatus Limnocylindrales bacterium]